MFKKSLNVPNLIFRSWDYPICMLRRARSTSKQRWLSQWSILMRYSTTSRNGKMIWQIVFRFVAYRRLKVRSWNHLISMKFIFYNDVLEFVNYMESVYIGRLLPNGGRTQPMYPAPLWNSRDRIMYGLQMGNSAVESYNARLKVSPLTTFTLNSNHYVLGNRLR